MKNHIKKLLIFGILLATILACSLAPNLGGDTKLGDQIIPLDQGVTSTVSSSGSTDSDSEVSLLSIQLSDGQAQPQEAVPITFTEGEPLTTDEIAAIQGRLPDLETDTADQTDFRLPEEILPPPRTGDTIEETFPLVEVIAPETVESGPLEVLRYSPEGEIPIAPFVAVTFNQPMVPLTTLEDLAMEDVPVIVEPEMPGTWRWLGTKTLNFQYLCDRWPNVRIYKPPIF